MNAIFKTLLAVAFVVVETLTVFAQVPSLPIGSTNAVLEDAVSQINEFSLAIELLSEDGLGVEKAFKKNFPYSRTSVSNNLEKLMAEELRKMIEATRFNYKEWETRQFQTKYVGVKWLSGLPGTGGWYLLFGTINEFTLVSNEKGELTVPESAYKIDLVAALMRSYGHAFFIPGIDYALIEVEDGTGKVILKDDSRNHVVGGGEGEVVVNRTDEVVGITATLVTSGQPGKVTIGYKTGAKRVYRLSDGTLFPQLEFARKTEGLELTVLGVDDFVIESSTDFKAWGIPYTLVPLSGTPPQRFLEKNPNGGNLFYRVRVSEPALQKR